MLFHGHVLLGILAFLFTKNLFSGGNQLIFFCLVLLGALLPDIDEPNSRINKWSGIIGKIIGKLFKHRGFLHSILFFIILFLIIKYYFSAYYAYAIVIGYSAHVVGDGISLMGLNPFYPFKFKVKGPMRVGGKVEMVLTILFYFLIIKQLF